MPYQNNKRTTIILAGGGSGGPVSPLLATAARLREMDPAIEFLFIGGITGPERIMAEKEGISFISIPESRLRRYFTLKNLWAPIQLIRGFVKSIKILRAHTPSAVFGAGSFLQVPITWAAKLLRIPVIIHQQDITRTLSNILSAPTAHTITVTFQQSLSDFPSNTGLTKNSLKAKIVWVGNPCRYKKLSSPRTEAVQFFGLDTSMPTILIMGGGTGAQYINTVVDASVEELSKFVNVIHIAGKGKAEDVRQLHYYRTEFLQEMDLAYHAADIVVSRAGLSSITELSVFEKPSIIIPIPHSQQEANAQLLKESSASLIFDQSEFTSEKLITAIRKLLFHAEAQEALKHGISEIMPHDADARIAEIILKIIHTPHGK